MPWTKVWSHITGRHEDTFVAPEMLAEVTIAPAVVLQVVRVYKDDMQAAPLTKGRVLLQHEAGITVCGLVPVPANADEFQADVATFAQDVRDGLRRTRGALAMMPRNSVRRNLWQWGFDHAR